MQNLTQACMFDLLVKIIWPPDNLSTIDMHPAPRISQAWF
jgi:hypothetical protein